MTVAHRPASMTVTLVEAIMNLRPAVTSPRLLAELDRLRRENAHLREENRHLRLALDSYIARARSTSLFGPVEMTAGTCVGPACHDPVRR